MIWGPYGKSGSGHPNLDKFPLRAGVPESNLSGYESFEGLDPAEWVPKGYAVVNVDPRGVGDSEGDLRWWGTAEGRDGYDVVEEIASLPWCNGKVAMAGNSWFAMSQWYIAAERPPHLACIAPLEGASDPLRENLCRGGIPSSGFASIVASTLCGRQEQEDMVAMMQKYPLANEYWEDKRAKFRDIQVPAYVLASYSTGLHTIGSFRGFEEIPHEQKWLVSHATQEWYDLYSDQRIKELQSFFDFCLKGVKNAWEQTSRVRLALLKFDKPAILDQPFADLPWLLPNALSQRLFLTGDNKLSPTNASVASSLSYQADAPSRQMVSDAEELRFAYVFPERTVVAGPSKVVVYIASPDNDDIDIYTQLRKADKDGNILQHSNIPLQDLGASSLSLVPSVNVLKYLGPQGMLRLSRRHVAEDLSSKWWKTLSHAKIEPVVPGEVVRVEIYIWSTGMAFEAGEQLILKLSGHDMSLAEF